MKICKQCDRMVDDYIKFCPNCGGSEFQDIYDGEETLELQGDFYQAGAYRSPEQSAQRYDAQYQSPESSYRPYDGGVTPSSAPAKKPKNKKKIAIIVVVVLFVLGGLGGALEWIAQRYLVNENVIDSDIEISLPDGTGDVAYAAGTIVDGVYSNEWAGLRFDMGEDWVEATQDAYDSYEDDITTCDFYGIRQDGALLAVVMIDLSSQWDANLYTDEEFMDEYISGLIMGMDSYEISDIQSTTLAGSTYLYVDAQGEVNGGTFCFSAYLQRKDECIILINITSSDITANHEIVSAFTAC